MRKKETEIGNVTILLRKYFGDEVSGNSTSTDVSSSLNYKGLVLKTETGGKGGVDEKGQWVGVEG